MTIYVIGTPKKVLGKLKETACRDNFDTHIQENFNSSYLSQGRNIAFFHHGKVLI